MTIKAYVLDALQKFWNRLKTSYVTDCVTDDDNLALAASQGKVLQDQITGVPARVSALESKTTALTRDANHYSFSNAHLHVPNGYIFNGSTERTGEARVILDTVKRGIRLAISNNTGYTGIWDSTDERDDKTGHWLMAFDGNGETCRIYQELLTTNPLLLYSDSDMTMRPVICTAGGTAGQIALMSTNSSYQLHITSNWGNASAKASSRYAATTTSDRRLKKNIEPNTKSGLALVNALDIKQFDWKESDRHWDYGIIAQEVRELDPNLVIGEEREDSYLGIDTLYLSNALVKAVQELTVEVEKLKAEVEYLKLVKANR